MCILSTESYYEAIMIHFLLPWRVVVWMTLNFIRKSLLTLDKAKWNGVAYLEFSPIFHDLISVQCTKLSQNFQCLRVYLWTGGKNFKVMATSAIAYRIAYVLKSDAFWLKETHPLRSRHLCARTLACHIASSRKLVFGGMV